MDYKQTSNEPVLSLTVTREELARDWLLLIESGEATEEEVACFEYWLNLDPLHRQCYERALAIWQAAGELKDLGNLEPLPKAKFTLWLSRWLNGNSIEDVKSRLPAVASVMAAACLLMVFSWGLLPSIHQHIFVDEKAYVTGIAETRQVNLTDGTRVHVGANTSLKVVYNNEQRNIWLQNGEAFFDVIPDKNRPFNVISGSTKIRVVGTRFNVRKAIGQVAIAVEEGKVQVVAENRSAETQNTLYLTRGKMASISDVGAVDSVSEVSLDSIGAWRNNLFVYRDSKLKSLVSDINRYSEINIVIQDPALNELQVTAVFPLEKSIEMLMALPQAFPLRVVRISDHQILINSKL